jgi:DNA polymerase I-like protein with 3'-5' exonuclease and polymerase domains
MYGASAKKLGETSGKGEAAGQGIKDAFYTQNTAIGELVSEMEREFQAGKKYIVAMDGRHIQCRQKHKLLNRRIQGNAAIIFKTWKVLCFLNIPELRDGSVKLVINVHDELQFESTLDLENTKRVGQEIVNCVALAANELGIRVRLDAEAKIGKDWYDTH